MALNDTFGSGLGEHNEGIGQRPLPTFSSIKFVLAQSQQPTLAPRWLAAGQADLRSLVSKPMLLPFSNGLAAR